MKIKIFMIEKSIIDGGSLKEQATVLPSTTAGVKKQRVKKACQKPVAIFGSYGDTSHEFWGIVYRRWLNKPDCEDHGKSYVGETVNEAARKRAWNNMSSRDYSGSKLMTPRKKYGLSCWGYEVLEIVYASSKEELKIFLYERETFYIAKYDSCDNGFNGNYGGSGNKGVKFDEARRKQNGDNRRGKHQSAATKEILRLKSTGRVKSAEERKKISDGNKGKKRTPEMRKAQSESMRGKVPTAANEARKGKPSKLKGQAQKPAAIANRVQSRKESGQRIKVTAPNGTITCYLCQTDAAKATGLKDGSVYYALTRPDGMHTKSGYKFERISDVKYQAWKSANQ